MWSRTPDDDMTLLLGAPRAFARPQDERSISRLRTMVHGDSVERQCWGVMVNKRLMPGDSSTASLGTRASSWIARVGAGDAVGWRPGSLPCRHAGRVSGAFAAGQEPRSGALSVSGAGADQNEQPYAVSEAFVASIVCLQVASMVVFAEGFLAMSIHALRV